MELNPLHYRFTMVKVTVTFFSGIIECPIDSRTGNGQNGPEKAKEYRAESHEVLDMGTIGQRFRCKKEEYHRFHALDSIFVLEY